MFYFETPKLCLGIKMTNSCKYIYFHLFFQQIPPATSCSLLIIFLLVCQNYCTPFILHQFSGLIFWTTFPFLLRWWAFCVIYNSHTLLPAASFFFFVLLVFPRSSSTLRPLLSYLCFLLSFSPPSPVFAVSHGQTRVKATWSSPWCGTNQKASTSSRPRPSSPGRSFSRFTEASKM